MSATAPEPTAPRLTLSRNDWLALAGVILAWAILFIVIRYCPSYDVNKAPFYQMWLGTFWNDLKGLFDSKPSGTLAGEATASEWSYCGAVPFIVAWLVWQMIPQLRKLPLKGQPAGFGILGAGFALYLMGFLMENYYVGMGALQIIYAGLIVLFFGWDIMRALIFPWAFIMFMWPYNFMEDVALELRLVMSSLSHHALQLLGMANELRGTAIVSLPDAKDKFAIDIADPCSGIRSLFALVMIAAVYAFLTFTKLWQQAIIVALAVPLVIVGNLVRIMLLAFATIHFGEPFALGTNESPSWFHEGAGYLVYLINFGGLILLGSLLTRLTTPKSEHARA